MHIIYPMNLRVSVEQILIPAIGPRRVRVLPEHRVGENNRRIGGIRVDNLRRTSHSEVKHARTWHGAVGTYLWTRVAFEARRRVLFRVVGVKIGGVRDRLWFDFKADDAFTFVQVRVCVIQHLCNEKRKEKLLLFEKQKTKIKKNK